MTPTQTVALVAMCRAANPGWTPLDGTAELWHGAALRDLDPDLAKAAVLRLVRDQAPWWPNPADIARVAGVIAAEQRPRPVEDDERFDVACPFPGCGCSHSGGCVRGWIDQPDGRTAPCPVCRWNRQQQPGEARQAWLARLRSSNLAQARVGS